LDLDKIFKLATSSNIIDWQLAVSIIGDKKNIFVEYLYNKFLYAPDIIIKEERLKYTGSKSYTTPILFNLQYYEFIRYTLPEVNSNDFFIKSCFLAGKLKFSPILSCRIDFAILKNRIKSIYNLKNLIHHLLYNFNEFLENFKLRKNEFIFSTYFS